MHQRKSFFTKSLYLALGIFYLEGDVMKSLPLFIENIPPSAGLLIRFNKLNLDRWRIEKHHLAGGRGTFPVNFRLYDLIGAGIRDLRPLDSKEICKGLPCLLHIIDYKHGLGVLVSAEKNSQLSCYALGALDLFDGIYDIAQVSLTIYQPRRENVSTYTMIREELLAWAETVLAPAAKLAYEGKGEFKAGDHCQFCKAKATCRKRAEYNLELARYDFEMPALLGDDEVAAILTKADELVSWAGDIKDYALQKALSGTKFTGFKVVEGRSNRKYTDEAAVAKAVENAGYEPYEKKLLGITAMSQALGRKKFEELLGGLVYKPPGKPVLVPESDKRPAMNTAINDFKENEEDNNYGKDRK